MHDNEEGSLPARGKLVSYDALPAAVWEMVAPHFALSIDDRLRQLMAETARINSKAPIGTAPGFEQDSAMKQQAASAGLRQAVDSFARPELEGLRSRHGF